MATVKFLIKDIVHPHPLQVLCDLYEKNQLQGEVVAITNDGQEPCGFLVVKVHGLSEPVIVPTIKTTSPQIPQTAESSLQRQENYGFPG